MRIDTGNAGSRAVIVGSMSSELAKANFTAPSQKNKSCSKPGVDEDGKQFCFYKYQYVDENGCCVGEKEIKEVVI